MLAGFALGLWYASRMVNGAELVKDIFQMSNAPTVANSLEFHERLCVVCSNVANLLTVSFVSSQVRVWTVLQFLVSLFSFLKFHIYSLPLVCLVIFPFETVQIADIRTINIFNSRSIFSKLYLEIFCRFFFLFASFVNRFVCDCGFGGTCTIGWQACRWNMHCLLRQRFWPLLNERYVIIRDSLDPWNRLNQRAVDHEQCGSESIYSMYDRRKWRFPWNPLLGAVELLLSFEQTSTKGTCSSQFV